MGPGGRCGYCSFPCLTKWRNPTALFLRTNRTIIPVRWFPFEGAATGVGGICRDIACMGARVIGALDSLRFGEITHPLTKRLLSGVTSGVGGYGNPLGVPNLGGDLLFDESFHEKLSGQCGGVGNSSRKSGILHSFVPENACRRRDMNLFLWESQPIEVDLGKFVCECVAQ